MGIAVKILHHSIQVISWGENRQPTLVANPHSGQMELGALACASLWQRLLSRPRLLIGVLIGVAPGTGRIPGRSRKQAPSGATILAVGSASPNLRRVHGRVKAKLERN